ncbi:MAG: O-methyltransferase [Verrucomicrobiae bacterium]|nr:O-methyltransferase [Verrucomicrobiae bacterium]
MQPTWSAVDDYLINELHAPDPILDHAIANCQAAGLPEIQVSETLGKFLHLLARIHHAQRILEIGTLGSYSTIWLARALPPEGALITIELDPAHAEVARANLDSADVSDRVDLRLGAALDILPQIESEGASAFDFIFIDADKPSNVAYLEWAVKLSRSGSVIVLDNIVRDGAIIDTDSADEKVQGSRAALEWLGNHPQIESTAIQTVGAKGYDGFAIAVVK